MFNNLFNYSKAYNTFITRRKILKTANSKKKEVKRNIICRDNVPESDVTGIVNLYKELVPGDNTRPINIEMIKNEAFPKFEETIGVDSFKKVKKYFGIECRANTRNMIEVKALIPKLRTIENAQYYIVGYKELVKQIANKLFNAPKEMTDLEKAKVIRMFFLIFANNDLFLEDYVTTIINGKRDVNCCEKTALANNKLLVGPEELFIMFARKLKQSEGFFYDMMLLQFKRMYLEYNKYKSQISEILEFSELKYDKETNRFISVNRCVPGLTFGKMRNLKQKIHQVRTMSTLELFCNKETIENKIDITDLYVIYKTFMFYPWKEIAKMKSIKHRTFTGSIFMDKEQEYYELFKDFLIANEAEAERWITLMHYLAEHEIVLQTKFDGNGGLLPETKFYNAGVLFAVFKYANEMGYISKRTMVIRDFEIANHILAIDGAEEQFLRLKRKEVEIEELKTILGINEEFEKNILGIQKVEEKETEETPLVEIVIKFAINNGYVKAEDNVNRDLIENVFILGNEEYIEKFATGQMNKSELEKRIGFEREFAESYFDVSKIDIKKIETKLQDIKKYGKKEQIRKSKLLIALYCYLVKNGITCGSKNKKVKRNKGLKPEILEELIKL